MCYSIALDEATDTNDSAQVLFFIRLITLDFQCYEELLGLGTLTERTRRIDVLNLFNTLTAAKFSRYTLTRFIVKAHISHIMPICQTTE